MTNLSKIQEYLAVNRSRFIAELTEFLSIESISTDPVYQAGCLKCAEWLAAHLRGLGLSAELRFKGSGYPVLIAKSKPKLPAGESARAITFYGHYDVQPCDPLELWTTPPFKPQVRDGRLYARGAQDNKGQLWYVVKAIEYLKSVGALDSIPLTLCIEGQEESGSEVLAQNLTALSGDLRAETLLVCDTGTMAKKFATVTMGLRGIAHCTVILTGPSKDLHSGVHGGVARNPAQELSRLLASMYRPDGRISIDGFYDGVTEPTAAEVAAASAGAPNDTEYESMVGAKPLGGEVGLPLAVRGGLRPTLEINGVHSGYGGAGSKTIIPSAALAKLSMRLVKGQDGHRILELIAAHLTKHAVGVKVEISEQRVGGPALQLPADSAAVRRVTPCLTEITGAPPLLRWEGASIPIVSELSRSCGGEPLLVGFGLEEDNIHAPDESFALEQFDKGFLFAAVALAELAKPS